MITMKTPDISTIEKVLDNEATAEEAKWVVGWFKTEEGMKWLSERMDKDERQIHLGEEQEWVDHEIPSAVMYQRINQQLRRQTIRRWIFRAAAILIPITLFIGCSSMSITRLIYWLRTKWKRLSYREVKRCGLFSKTAVVFT